MKNNVRLCCFPAYPHTEASHKQKKICGPGIAALTECLYRHFSFNGQNVWHNGLSWRLSSSAISKCTLSGALLLHTIEKSLRGGAASVSVDFRSESFATEVKQTKINIYILQPRNTFSFNEKGGVEHRRVGWGKGGAEKVRDSGTLNLSLRSDSGFSLLKREPSHMKAAFSQL